MLLCHRMLYRANNYTNSVTLNGSNGDVLLTAGFNGACLNGSHLLTAAYYGNTRVVDFLDYVTALFTDIEFGIRHIFIPPYDCFFCFVIIL
jgi:hypothetical protein